MKTALRYVITGIAGIVVGSGAAWALVSSGVFNGDAIGAWTTGVDYGSSDASPLTRAAVARHGLLALPASEARYFSASVDNAGRPLDGSCVYTVSGADLGGAWWSITAYGSDGFLIENPIDRYSVPNRMATPDGTGWTINVGAATQPEPWLPVRVDQPFELTLRLYVPQESSGANLPIIEREGCEQ